MQSGVVMSKPGLEYAKDDDTFNNRHWNETISSVNNSRRFCNNTYDTFH